MCRLLLQCFNLCPLCNTSAELDLIAGTTEMDDATDTASEESNPSGKSQFHLDLICPPEGVVSGPFGVSRPRITRI